MKLVNILTPLAALALAGTASAFEQPKVYDLQPNDRVIVLGDSTTAQGSTVSGHIHLVDQALKDQVPALKAVVYGIGWSQHGSASLLGDKGLINQFVRTNPKAGPAAWKGGPPTVAIINMGLNDSKGGEAALPAHVGNLRKVVLELCELKVTPIVCATSLWGGLKQTKAYAEAARALAVELQCPLIDLYAAHAEHLTANPKDPMATFDGVHLAAAGEKLSATTILQAFGLKPVWRECYVRFAVMRHNWSTGHWGSYTVEAERPDGSKDKVSLECKGEPNAGVVAGGHPVGTKLTVTLNPPAGFEFTHWEDRDYRLAPAGSQPDLGKSATITLTLDRNRHLMGWVRPKNETPK
jgi:lysophospholipase L1-like esterase